MTNETNTTATADREAFENWCRSTFGQHTSLVRSPDGYAHAVAHPVLGSTYANLQMLWEAWQASRAQAAQAAPDQQEDPHWRWLALQFDEHRMQALGWLKATLNALPEDHPALADARAFLAAPPLSGEEVLAKRIAAAPSAPAAPTGWRTLPGQMPETGTPVLLDIGKKTPIRAMWAAKHSLEASYEAEPEWCDYSEEDDVYYSPEGWYEWNEHEENHWFVHAEARAWMPLPAVLPPAPKEIPSDQ